MGNFLQNLVGLLSSPITFFVLFALIGGIGRFASWVKDQRAKRDALAARRAAEAEALRTGRAAESDEPEPRRQQSVAAERQARLREMQEQRAAQLRELQQKRLAELRARRAAQQAKAGGRRAPQPGVPTPASSQLPPPRRTPRPQPPVQPSPQPARRAEPVSAPRPPAIATARPPEPGPTPAEGAYARTRDDRRNLDAFEIDRRSQTLAAASGGSSARPSSRDALFATRADLRRGIIAAEILGQPVALRDDA